MIKKLESRLVEEGTSKPRPLAYRIKDNIEDVWACNYKNKCDYQGSYGSKLLYCDKIV